MDLRIFKVWFLLYFILPSIVCDSRTEPRAGSNKQSQNAGSITSHYSDILFDTCTLEDLACLSSAAQDKAGLEAIISLHKKLDDDANGNVDLSESNDFLREELQYEAGFEKRQKAFHRNDDTHISAKELWEAWLRSEVHNWTIEQTADWLSTSVDLPQYTSNFLQNKVNGAHLPRMAVNTTYLSVLGIKDPIHKHKLSLKAMDVVLFGPPKDSQNYWKDFILVILLICGGLGVWYGIRQNKKFRDHLNRMTNDVDSLQRAEKALENLQQELVEAKQAQKTVISEKENLEKKLKDSCADLGELNSCSSDLEITQLKSEIEMLRQELQMAESELKDRCWAPPLSLQQWLQLTYEIENRAYIKKKLSAERQLQQAREACEKLRKKRSSLIGAFVSTHGKSIDEVDRSIVEARTSLNEVTHELQERVQRWKQIEQLCGFSIMNNSGIQYLENTLYRNSNFRSLGSKGRLNSSDDLLDDDTASMYGHQGSAQMMFSDCSWKDEVSSGSEASKNEDEYPKSNSVKFSVGEDSNIYISEASINKMHRSSSNQKNLNNNSNSKPFKKSCSQDTNLTTMGLLSKAKSLDFEAVEFPCVKKNTEVAIKNKEQSSTSLEDEICSTDSSMMDDDVKKKKKKFFNLKKGRPKID